LSEILFLYTFILIITNINGVRYDLGEYTRTTKKAHQLVDALFIMF